MTAQPDATADELAIRNLIARLAHLADLGDADAYIALFATDAQWGGANMPLRRGHAEILAGARERRAQGTTGPGSDTLHVVSTTAVALDGDRGRARSAFQFYGRVSEAPELRVVGAYEDRFVRGPEGWLLQRREIVGPNDPASSP